MFVSIQNFAFTALIITLLFRKGALFLEIERIVDFFDNFFVLILNILDFFLQFLELGVKPTYLFRPRIGVRILQ